MKLLVAFIAFALLGQATSLPAAESKLTEPLKFDSV